MNVKTLVSAGIVALTASASMAQSLDPVRIEMFRSILKGNECVMSEALAANILPRFDFTRDETRAIVGALVAAGEVRLDGSTLNLVDGSCETEDPVVALLGQRDVQQFIAVMAENSCAMNEADAEAIFTARGINKAQVGAVVGPMMAAGMASFEGGVLRVDSAYCTAPVVAQQAPPVVVGSPVESPSEMAELDRSGMFGMSRVRVLVDAMAANSCTLNMETPDGFLAEAGIEHSFATFVARKMIADGFASMVDGQTMQLPAPYCVSANSPAPVAPAETPSVEAPAVDMNMVASLREIFLANSCRLNEGQMDALLPPAGFTRDNIKPVFGYLESNGEMGEDGPDLVFYNDACTAAPAEVASAEMPAAEMDRSGMFGMSRVRALVDVMAQNGCTLNMEVGDGYLAAAGIEHSFATFVANKMITDGYANMVDAQNMVLAAPYCIAAGVAAPLVAQPVETPIEAPEEPPVEAPEVATMMGQSDGTPKGALLAIAAQSGCALNVESDRERLAQAGVRMDQAYRIVDGLIAMGDASLSDGGAMVSFNPALCGSEMQPVEQPVEAAEAAVEAAEAAVDAAEGAVDAAEGAVEAANAPVEHSDDPRAGLMAMLAANGCEVTQANVAGLVDAAGLDFNTTMQMLTQMMGNGEATSPDGGQTLQVSAPLCVAEAAVPKTPREAFINLIKQNNCSITAAEFSTLLPVDGLDANTAFAMISELEAEGVISLPATRDVVTLSAEMCR